MNDILVIVEHREGKIRNQTFAALAEAQFLNRGSQSGISVLMMGFGIQRLAEEASQYAENVFYCDDERLRLCNNELYCSEVVSLVETLKPRLILAGQSALSLDLMPALSVKLGLPLVTDCTDIVLCGDHVTVSRSAYDGRVKTSVSTKPSRCCLLTVKSSLNSLVLAKPGKLVKLDLASGAQPRCKSLELLKPASDDVDIAKAEVVVGVGLGIACEENVKLAEELASLMGGVVGCTRPVADKKWLPQTRQIGFSGKTINAALYFALGLSGSTHHVKGIEGTRTIIALNKDPGAPIFNYAKYGVIADLFEITPLLVEKLKMQEHDDQKNQEGKHV